MEDKGEEVVSACKAKKALICFHFDQIFWKSMEAHRFLSNQRKIFGFYQIRERYC